MFLVGRKPSAMRQMGSIIDTLVHCMHTHQILAHVILGMNQSALMSVGLLCTVGRNFSCVVPAGLLNPASHFCSNFRSFAAAMRFRAHKFRGTLAARSGRTEGEDTGHRMRQGTQGVHCALGCRAVPVVGSAGAEICDTFPSYSGTTVPVLGRSSGFAAGRAAAGAMGGHAQQGARSFGGLSMYYLT